MQIGNQPEKEKEGALPQGTTSHDPALKDTDS